jgi:hypothetical protein
MADMSLDQSEVASRGFGTKFDTQSLRRHFTKVLIREIPTGRYWESNGFWTSDIGKATSFHDCTAAFEEVTHWRLPLVQLVLTRELVVRQVIPLKTSVRA